MTQNTIAQKVRQPMWRSKRRQQKLLRIAARSKSVREKSAINKILKDMACCGLTVNKKYKHVKDMYQPEDM